MSPTAAARARARRAYLAGPATPTEFEDTLTAAVVATERLEAVVFDTPTRPDPAPPARPAPGVRARVESTGAGQWKITAPTLAEALAAAHRLGQVRVGHAQEVTRGLGPWRTTEVVLTVTGLAEPAQRPEPAGESEASAPAPGDSLAAGTAVLEQLLTAAGVTPEEDTGTEVPGTREDPAEGDPAAASPPPSGDLAHRPVLPDPAPAPEDLDWSTADLVAQGLSAQVVAQAAALRPESPQDWADALLIAVDEALARAGHLDPERGGGVVSGVGPAGAVAIVNAASRGEVLGTFTLGGVSGPPSAPRLLEGLLWALQELR
jgi:hypothetical protein